jgi:hypothetical protein
MHNLLVHILIYVPAVLSRVNRQPLSHDFSHILVLTASPAQRSRRFCETQVAICFQLQIIRRSSSSVREDLKLSRHLCLGSSNRLLFNLQLCLCLSLTLNDGHTCCSSHYALLNIPSIVRGIVRGVSGK